MTTSSSPAGRLRYRFSLDEHDWLGDVEDPEAELVRRAASVCPSRVDGEGSPLEPRSWEQFVAEIHDALGEEMAQPEAGKALVERLAAWLTEQGLSFLSGNILSFEGHHNDTEGMLEVVRSPRG